MPSFPDHFMHIPEPLQNRRPFRRSHHGGGALTGRSSGGVDVSSDAGRVMSDEFGPYRGTPDMVPIRTFRTKRRSLRRRRAVGKQWDVRPWRGVVTWTFDAPIGRRAAA